MNPFYQADLEKGNITKESAQEIINCLWIKINEFIWLLPKNGSKYYAGYSGFTNLSVGGRNMNGSDAVNDIKLYGCRGNFSGCPTGTLFECNYST